MSAVYNLVLTGGPRLGDIESGLVAGLTSATTAVRTGGLACIAGAFAMVAGFPAFVRYDSREQAAEGPDAPSSGPR